MKTVKKFLAVALSVLLIAAVLPFPAFAEEPPTEGECGENATWWVVKTGDVLVSNETDVPVEDPEQADPDTVHYENRYTLVIEGSGAMTDFVFDFEHPENSVFQPWDEYAGLISQIEVCEGITHIGENAFRWHGNLKAVSLPEGLLSIGAFAFESCKFGVGVGDAWTPVYGLEEITIPASVTYIAGQAFAHNDYLETVHFDGNLADICLAGEEETADWNPWDRVREVFDGSPYYDQWFWENYFSGTCGENATWRLEENGDGYWAYNDQGNPPVEDPNDYNTENTHWEPRYTLYIEGTGAMDDFNYETEETVRQPWEAMRWAVTEVDVADGITNVGESAFRWFNELRTVSLPESVTEIGPFAFQCCVSGHDYGSGGLAEITIPAAVTVIGRQAFTQNDFLETVNFAGDLEEVCLAGEDYAEDWNPAERVRDVFDNTPWYAQWVHDNYMQGTCGENATWQIVENEDGYWAYNDPQNTPVEDPDDYDTGDTHFETRYTLYVNGTGDMDDYNYDEWNGDIVRQPWDLLQREISQVIVADGITSLGASAFREFNRLAVVQLPETLTRIGGRAFENCRNGWGDEHSWQAYSGLEEITIPVGVTYIGTSAFNDDRFLSTVNFEGDLEAVCLAGEEYAEGWNPSDRVREVFNGTPWYEQWIEDNFMQGTCGENATWQIVENEDGYWAYNDPQNTPVEDPDDYDTDDTHFEKRYTLYINGTGDMDDYNYDDWNGDEIVRQPWEPLHGQISRVTVAEGITSVGDYAFFEFNQLAVVQLPESLTRIGAGAFQNCRNGWGDGHSWQAYSGLEEITIPASVTHIGAGAFNDDRFLSTVNFEGDLEAVCLAGEEYAAGWNPSDRVREVFDNTPWYDAWIRDNYMQGDCGENAAWEIVENEDGYWAYNDQANTPVEDPEDYNTDNTHFETRYTLYINGTGDMDDYNYDDWNGDEIVRQPWEPLHGMISRVTVADGITSVGDYAFFEFNRLAVVELPESLTDIGAGAFQNCRNGWGDENSWQAYSGLAEITIPAGVAYVGSRAFGDDRFLQTVNFEGDLAAVCLAGEEYAQGWTPSDRVRDVFGDTPWYEQWIEVNFMQGICGENATWLIEENEDGYWAWNDQANTPVEDPDDYNTNDTHWEQRYTLYINGTGDMDDYNYNDQFGDIVRQPWEPLHGMISRVTVADGITSVGDYAFFEFNRLAVVQLPESLTRIGAGAFQNCRNGWGDEHSWQAYSGLEEITIPAGVTYIGNSAFGDDRFLSTVNFEGDIEAVCLAGDEYAEGWTGMERVFSVFNDTPWLEAFIQENYLHGECGEGITWRLVDNEDGVFVYNENGEIVPDPDAENEEDIHFERRLTLIIEGSGAMEDYVFDFENFENTTLPPWEFFWGMITRIEVCEGITHVGDNAFRWTDQLKTVSLPDSLLSIGAFAFENCVHSKGEGEDRTPLYGLEEITIPANVTYIGEEAFANNNFLTKVDAKCDLEAVCLAGDEFWGEFPAVSRVMDVFHDTPWFAQWVYDNYMHGSCGENVTWKLELTGEGVWAYAETGAPVEDPELYGTDGTFFADFLELVITGEGPMYDYENGIPPLDYYGINVRYITIESGVTAIGENAFVNCPSAHTVSLPLSLTRVGENAFSACPYLATVIYEDPGDAEDWAAITIEDGNEPLLQANITLHTHTPGAAQTENEVPATCEGAGSYDTVRYCTACGKELSRDTVPTDPLGHDYGPVTYVWAEDCSYCTAKRVCRRDASHVAEEKSDPSTAERTEPGCTEDGKIVYTAFFANESLDTQVKTVVLPKLGHNYQPTVTAPTCTDKGYTTYLCSRCGDSYIDDETAANGHTPGQAVTENEVPATCTGAGSYDTVVYCTVCGAQISRETVPTDPLGHDYVDHAAKAPTCTAIGWDAYQTCTRCDYTTYAEKAALGHDLVDHEANAPTCTAIGWDAYQTCTRCDYTTYAEKAALGHDLVDHEAKAPTCTAIGWDAYKTCTRCDYTTYAEKAALGHDLVDHEAKAPTCAEPGWAAYRTCSRCDYTTFVEIPATGQHTWDGGTVTKKPTASEPGVMTYTCTVCKQTKPEEIPKLNVPVIDGEKAKEQNGNVYAAVGLTADELLKLAGEGATLTKADGTAVQPGQAVGSGMVLTKADGTKETVIVKGDNDGDGKVTTNDARNALRAAIGLDRPNEWQKAASLVVSSDVIRTADARGILRAAIGLDKLALV